MIQRVAVIVFAAAFWAMAGVWLLSLRPAIASSDRPANFSIESVPAAKLSLRPGTAPHVTRVPVDLCSLEDMA
jgi:hypothetical protein